MATHTSFNSAFKSMYRKLNSVQRSLPGVLANEGTKFFVSNFDLGGFTDVGFRAWKPRKQFTSNGKRIKKFNKKKILVKTGRLRRAVNNSVKEKSFRQIVWRIDPGAVPYAARHNEGLDGMPRRHYMGKSYFLYKRFRLRIKQAYIKAFEGR